jgi:pimeloyl-ACP methyl ester carboxylesterase
MSPAVPASLPDRSRLVGPVGQRVFVTDVGDGERPLVVLHDVLQCGFAFDAVAQQLAPTRRVVVVDLPGAGESDRPDPDVAERYAPRWLAARIEATLGELGLARVDVLAQGFGAVVAFALALAEPDRVARLVAIAPPLSGMQLPHELRLARLPRVGELALERVYRRADLRRTMAGWWSSPELVVDLAIDVWWDRLGRAGGFAAARAMLLQLSELGPLATAAQGLAVPTLLLWGDRDKIVLPADCERWRGLLPHAEAVVIEGCGHAVAEERPERVVAEVLRFTGPVHG